MMTPCPFYSPDDRLQQRVFYESPDWFSFLDRTPLAPAHAVLVRRRRDGSCPVGLTSDHLAGHDAALSDVLGKLRRRHATNRNLKDFLIASLRQVVPRVHTHIVPLWTDDEIAWRECFELRSGSMFRYLGHLEEKASRRDRNEGDADLAAGEESLATEAAVLKTL
jgi:diadenosine tetraphosphate (Ap4A) HIT family hydrolase